MNIYCERVSGVSRGCEDVENVRGVVAGTSAQKRQKPRRKMHFISRGRKIVQ